MAEAVFELVRLNPTPVVSPFPLSSPSPKSHSKGWTCRPTRAFRHKCGRLGIPAIAAERGWGVSSRAISGSPWNVAQAGSPSNGWALIIDPLLHLSESFNPL